MLYNSSLSPDSGISNDIDPKIRLDLEISPGCRQFENLIKRSFLELGGKVVSGTSCDI